MDSDSWTSLTELYGPVVYRWARLANLQPDDASEVVQEVFQSIFQNIESFDQRSFRGWLWTITKNTILYRFRKLKKVPKAEGGSDFHSRVQSIPDGEVVEQLIPNDPDGTESAILQKTLELIRSDFHPTTWQAFWLTTIKQRSTAEVAEELGLSMNAVKQARYRVRVRIKEFLELASQHDEE